MVVCIEHLRFKKGVCAACGNCKKCTPPESCSNKENHIVGFQGIQRNVTPCEKILCPRRGKHPSRHNEDVKQGAISYFNRHNF